MNHHQPTLTTYGIQKLRTQIMHLKDRYDRITEDLREKTQSHNVLAIKSIEKEMIYSDMTKMNVLLSHAKVFVRGAAPEEAEQGTKVSYVQEDTGEQHVVTLVDPLEADPSEGFLSTDSPVGSKLLGCGVGDSIVIKTPKGSLHLTVMSLE
jgi:transcription elongation factor GreA